ncbi:MAG: hypothetical protein N3A66_04330, partial [Planctomycetota bacterium]|nr:hypothetical protein [Planctomycetota bacterium]
MSTANSIYLIGQNAIASLNEKTEEKANTKMTAEARSALAHLQEALFKIQSCQKWLPIAFHIAVSGSVLFMLFTVFSLTYAALLFFLQWSHLLLAAVAAVPAFLFAPATGQMAGNMMLRCLT